MLTAADKTLKGISRKVSCYRCWLSGLIQSVNLGRPNFLFPSSPYSSNSAFMNKTCVSCYKKGCDYSTKSSISFWIDSVVLPDTWQPQPVRGKNKHFERTIGVAPEDSTYQISLQSTPISAKTKKKLTVALLCHQGLVKQAGDQAAVTACSRWILPPGPCSTFFQIYLAIRHTVVKFREGLKVSKLETYPALVKKHNYWHLRSYKWVTDEWSEGGWSVIPPRNITAGSTKWREEGIALCLLYRTRFSIVGGVLFCFFLFELRYCAGSMEDVYPMEFFISRKCCALTAPQP